MVKRVETHTYCDRCGVAHGGYVEGPYSLKVRNSNLKVLLEWDDLCMACSVQIDGVLKGLHIGEKIKY